MIGREKARAMPIFHVITGCDTTSEFKGKKKKTAWEIWNEFPEVTQAFLHLMDERELSRDNFNIIQHYMCVMYSSRTRKFMMVNEARGSCLLRTISFWTNPSHWSSTRTAHQEGSFTRSAHLGTVPGPFHRLSRSSEVELE